MLVTIIVLTIVNFQGFQFFSIFADWQKDCLTRNELKAGENFLYILPTSGGKTLVAEILIMKCLLCHKKNAVLVLPYVAIVQEKVIKSKIR